MYIMPGIISSEVDYQPRDFSGNEIVETFADATKSYQWNNEHIAKIHRIENPETAQKKAA